MTDRLLDAPAQHSDGTRSLDASSTPGSAADNRNEVRVAGENRAHANERLQASGVLPQLDITKGTDSGRVETGADKQKIHFDANNRINEINYPNGMNVNLQRDATGNISEAKITGGGPAVDGTYKRNADHYDRFDAAGRKTGDKVTSVEIRHDGSAEIRGENALGLSGVARVQTNGKVTQALF